MRARNKLVLLVTTMVLIGLSGCGKDSEKTAKEQERIERRNNAKAEANRKTAEALSKGAVLLTKSDQGEVSIETYEIPRPSYILGSPYGLTKDICVVYQRRGQNPLMSCYPTERN